MKEIPNFSNQDKKVPIERFNKLDFINISNEADFYQAKLDSIKEEFKIKNLDDLAKEVRHLVNDWHKMTNIDEGDLRERETIIHEALLRLKPSQDWKNKHVDLFVEYIQAGDDMRVINFVKEEFNLQQIKSLGSLGAKRVLDQIQKKQAISEENVDNQEKPSSLINNQSIIKDKPNSEN